MRHWKTEAGVLFLWSWSLWKGFFFFFFRILPIFQMKSWRDFMPGYETVKGLLVKSKEEYKVPCMNHTNECVAELAVPLPSQGQRDSTGHSYLPVPQDLPLHPFWLVWALQVLCDCTKDSLSHNLARHRGQANRPAVSQMLLRPFLQMGVTLSSFQSPGTSSVSQHCR